MLIPDALAHNDNGSAEGNILAEAEHNALGRLVAGDRGQMAWCHERKVSEPVGRVVIQRFTGLERPS